MGSDPVVVHRWNKPVSSGAVIHADKGAECRSAKARDCNRVGEVGCRCTDEMDPIKIQEFLALVNISSHPQKGLEKNNVSAPMHSYCQV